MQSAEGFGNYLYIIFAVVYIIYSIVKAGKKVKQNRPTIDKTSRPSPTVQPPVSSPAPQHESGDELKKMLEELLGGGEEEEIPEKPVASPVPSVIPHKPAPKPVYQAARKEKQVEDTSKQKATLPVPGFHAHPEIIRQAFTGQEPEEVEEIDFDIRQAVIYSEILKRPSY